MVDISSLQSALTALGINDQEQALYLACLKQGESPIMPLATKVGLPRTTVYHMLERLQQKGLIEIGFTSSRRSYAALPPKTVLRLLRQQRNQLDSTTAQLEEHLPDLVDLLSRPSFVPKLRVMKGKEIRQFYDEILKAPIDEYYYICEVTKIEKVLGQEFLKNWIRQRISLKIKSRAIWIKSEEVTNVPLYLHGRRNLRTVRYAPEDFRCPTQIAVYGDTVLFITTDQENIGVQITSRDLATSMRHLFKQLWRVSSSK